MGYIRTELEINSTPEFDAWFRSLASRPARVKVLARVMNMRRGSFGVCRPVGEGVSESKIDHGPGYRLYFTRTGNTVFLLLLGGDKSTQRRDIQRAKSIASLLSP
jgi:putative addiction module killer protein